jgi:hypothetical protein
MLLLVEIFLRARQFLPIELATQPPVTWKPNYVQENAFTDGRKTGGAARQ